MLLPRVTICDTDGVGNCTLPAGLAGDLWAAMAEPAAWTARQRSAVVVLKSGVLLLVGGHDGASRDDVWESVDNGVTWHRVLEHASLSPRYGHGAVVAADGESVLVLSGRGDGLSFMNDVWRGSDGGTVWVEIQSTAPWAPRSGAGLSVTSVGTVVLAGGLDGSTQFNDVWVSSDEGVTWAQVTPAAAWQSRSAFAFATLGDDSLVVAGGQGTSEIFGDVWRSADGGATWAQLPAAPWSPRSHNYAVAHGDTVVMVSGIGSGSVLHAEVWRSEDGGASWTELTGSAAPGWVGRYGHSVVALRDGSVMLLGGYTTGQLGDVWLSAYTAAGLWSAGQCDHVKLGVCGAVAGSSSVTVSLPAAAGSASPPNAASAVASVAYAPPIPVIASTQSGVGGNVLTFSVSLSAPVTGLQANDFAVEVRHSHTGNAIMADSKAAGGVAALVGVRTLSGAGSSWVLTVVMDAAAVNPRVCPPGFVTSSSGEWCAKALRKRGSWSTSNDACGPYTLATAASLRQLAFLGVVRDWPSRPHWCVCQRCPCYVLLPNDPHCALCCTRLGLHSIGAGESDYVWADEAPKSAYSPWDGGSPASDGTGCGYIETASGTARPASAMEWHNQFHTSYDSLTRAVVLARRHRL